MTIGGKVHQSPHQEINKRITNQLADYYGGDKSVPYWLYLYWSPLFSCLRCRFVFFFFFFSIYSENLAV
jgi:hypothetical protein